MLTTRRKFLQLLGIGSAALAAGMELLRPEGEGKIWQVSRAAPVRDLSLARELEGVGELSGLRQAPFSRGFLSAARLQAERSRKAAGATVLGPDEALSMEEEIELWRAYRTLGRNKGEGRPISDEDVHEHARALKSGDERAGMRGKHDYAHYLDRARRELNGGPAEHMGLIGKREARGLWPKLGEPVQLDPYTLHPLHPYDAARREQLDAEYLRQKDLKRAAEPAQRGSTLVVTEVNLRDKWITVRGA